ncbi:hypothetical protein HC928_01440 [bacterium]|nr:hypothetical protein [bacterium]
MTAFDEFGLNALIEEMNADLIETSKGKSDPGRFFALEDFALLTDEPVQVILEKRAEYRFINGLRRQTLTALIPELPPPGTDLYILGNGAGAERTNGTDRGVFDFGTFIPYLIHMVAPDGGATLLVSSWTMNKRNADAIVECLENGAVADAMICTDPYFNAREPQIATYLASALIAGGHRYAAFRNHAKVICVASKDRARTAVVTGSANLSSQPRVEQYVLTTSTEVFAFFSHNLFDWAWDHVQRRHSG